MTNEPVIGPTETKVPTMVYIKHEDMPGLSDATLNTRVKFMVTGKVISNRSKQEHMDGEAQIEVISIEDEQPEKRKNAATMHLSDLKDKIMKEKPEEEKETEEESE
jgi:hypothetical protein